MLLGYLGLLQHDPAAWFAFLVATVFGIVTAVTVHEAAHAWSALQLGDRTALRQGRVTLNPKAHLDPAGSVLFLLTFFGWGKPTPVNPMNLNGNRTSSMAIVSAAGPVSNLVTAAIFAAPFHLGLLQWQAPFTTIPLLHASTSTALAELLSYAVFFNVILAVFNLIPLPPLDGFTVALRVLPRNWAETYAKIGRYGAGPLVALLLLGFMVHVDVISYIVSPISNFFMHLFSGTSFFLPGVS